MAELNEAKIQVEPNRENACSKSERENNRTVNNSFVITVKGLAKR